MHDLAEHSGTLVALVGCLASVIGFLIWRVLIRIEEKLDEYITMHHQCREELPKNYVRVDAFEKWQDGREKIWEAINDHSHDAKGRVIR